MSENTAEEIAKSGIEAFSHEGKLTEYAVRIIVKNTMQEHTLQTLDRLKEKVELPETKISGKSYSKAFMKGRISENKRILKLIKKVSDE